MLEVGSERAINERLAGWLFVVGGVAFVLLTGALAFAHVALGVPINGQAGAMPPSGEMVALFGGALMLGAVVAGRGLWILRRHRS